MNEDILEMDEIGTVRLDALQPVVEAVDLIQGSIPIEQQIHKLQRVTTTPLSIFENQNDLEILAFPTLSPMVKVVSIPWTLIRATGFTPLEGFLQGD